MPEAWFRLLLPEVAAHKNNDVYPTRRESWGRTLSGDCDDLHRALSARGDSNDVHAELVGQYSAMRTAMNHQTPLPRTEDGATTESQSEPAPVPPPFDLEPYEELLAAIPEEFALYVRGAAAYRNDDAKSAEASWTALLALPESERQYRSTWATYMLGRMFREHDREKSDAFFDRVQALVDSGYADSVGFAADARGWQARNALDAANVHESMRRYLELFLNGPDLVSREAAESLRSVCRESLRHGDQLASIAEDPDTRRVLTAWVVSHPEEHVDAMRHWMETLRQNTNQAELPDDPLAAAIGRLSEGMADGNVDPDIQDELRNLAQSGYRVAMANPPLEKVWYPRQRPIEGDLLQAMRYYIDAYTHALARPGRADSNSLGFVCARVLQRTELFDEFAADPACRQVITAWLVSHRYNYPDVDQQWLDAVRNAVGDGPVEHADRLAWIAYNDGDMEGAAQWLEAADPDSPYTRWIQSKLLMRDGKIEEAVAGLREVIPAFPEDYPVVETFEGAVPPEPEIVQSEIGVLLLGRKDYINALDALMRSPYWMDAAYVAERVLTVEELREYVDAHREDEAFASPFTEGFWYSHETSKLDALEYLLARRYARLGQWKEALPLLPEGEQAHAQELGGLLTAAAVALPEKGFLGTVSDFVSGLWGSGDERIVDRERADTYYHAAEILRAHGMELAGTELEPDWHAFEGYYELPGVSENRAAGFDNDSSGYAPALAEALSASDDECERAAAHAPEPNQRFHYRYVASDLMWQAAQCLPDNDLKCASALYWGGTYLQNRDPQAADRFYKTLVWRNLNLPYAQRADKLRWFPPEPPE
jgi:hypothetical protein